jgi:hypothetical protein
MDGPQFDAWTRRRFGLAARGLAVSAFGLAAMTQATAKKKRRRKRCKKLLATCTPGGKRKFCGDLRCARSIFNTGTHTQCCQTEGKPCRLDVPFECCDGLACGGDSRCTPTPSDRAIKANFGSVDAADMLQRVRELPISTWNYTSDDPAVRHIGPMAQDFAALFGVGADDRHIHPLDGQGVALAAIQGLLNQVETLREENARLAARVAALEKGGR